MADNEVNDQAPAAEPVLEAVADEGPLIEEMDDIDEQPQPILQHLALAPHQQQTPFSTLALLYAIQCLRLAFLLLNTGYTVTKRVSKGLIRSLQEEVYVFFANTPYAYRMQDTVLTGPGVPPVQWYYKASTKQFISGALYNATDDYVFHHLPYLSAEIKYNNLNLYDISEFLEGIRWAGEQAPTPAVLLSVWSLTSGVVLNTNGFSLAVISEQGQEQTIALG
jgi:hypothetical protein